MGRRTELILYDPFRKDGGLIIFFGISRIKFSEIIWLDCEPCGKNQYKTKEYNEHISVFKKFNNNDA